MNRCLTERGLVRVYTREETAAERCHLQLCADCTERYDRLVSDLQTISHTLVATPPLSEARPASALWRAQWMPAALACATVLAVVLDVAWVRRSSPVLLTPRTTDVSVFASDLSDALFADANSVSQLSGDAPYLDSALEAGRPCSREQFLSGECNDPFSALVEDE